MEIGEVLMVVEDDSRERGSLDVVAPGAEGANDAKKLSIVDLIVSFSGGKGLRNEGTRMPYVINVVLVENGTCGEEGGISLNLKWLCAIWNKKDRVLRKAELEVGEGVVVFGGPEPGRCLLQQFVKGSCKVSVMINKTMIKVTKS